MAMTRQNLTPLTDDQRQLIEKYYRDFDERQLKKCIWKVYKRILPEEMFNDCLGVAREAVIKAAKNYDPKKKTKFPSFVEINVISALKTDFRDRYRNKRKVNEEHDSLDREVDTWSEYKTSLGDFIEDESEKKKIETEELYSLRSYLKTLTSLEKDIAIAMLLGASKSQFCEVYDITMGNFNLILEEMKPNRRKNHGR